MPRRFLESMYLKLTKKELVDAIYRMGQRFDDLAGQRNDLAVKLMKAKRKIKKLQGA